VTPREHLVDVLRSQPVIGIVRENDAAAAAATTDLLLSSGIRAVEISLTTPGALEVLRATRRHGPAEALLGAGTVLTPEQVSEAAAAGAQFVVAPIARYATVARAGELGLACVPGAMSVTEIADAVAWGADLVKVFPASLWSPRSIADVLIALPGLPVVPTGGIAIEDAAGWIRAGAVGVGMGGSLAHLARVGGPSAIQTWLHALEEESTVRANP